VNRGNGTILFTGGGLAFKPLPHFGALAIGKAGLRSLVQSLCLETSGTGVYVGSVLVAGYVQKGSDLDPDRIADAFWRMHVERPESHEIVLKQA
jgi:short-subunit dehydrogenase